MTFSPGAASIADQLVPSKVDRYRCRSLPQLEPSGALRWDSQVSVIGPLEAPSQKPLSSPPSEQPLLIAGAALGSSSGALQVPPENALDQSVATPPASNRDQTKRSCAAFALAEASLWSPFG